MNKKIYFENLDGLRAIAALSVMFYHITKYVSTPESPVYLVWKNLIGFNGYGGQFGVIFFFILSGFLISYLLFVEKVNDGGVRIGSFYMRRILRIWPLYYFSILVGFYIIPYLFSTIEENANSLHYFIFASNFDRINSPTPSIQVLEVQWSVAIEEQFYLLWPLLFFIKNHKAQLVAFITALVSSEIFYLNQDSWESGYFHFFSSIRYLSFGAILAYMSYFGLDRIKMFLGSFSRLTTFLVYLISIALLSQKRLFLDHSIISFYIIEALPFLFFGFVILEQCYSKHSFFKIGNSIILNRIGKISYGIYLIHMMSVYFVIKLLEWIGYTNFFAAAVGIVLVTLLASDLSYRYFENYFLKMKSRFRQGIKN